MIPDSFQKTRFLIHSGMLAAEVGDDKESKRCRCNLKFTLHGGEDSLGEGWSALGGPRRERLGTYQWCRSISLCLCARQLVGLV